MLNNLYFCGKLYDADCVVNKVDGKIIGERWFEEDLDESGCGLIGVMSWLCPGGTERIFLFEFSINILSPPNALLAHTYHPLSFHHSNHTRWAVMLMKLLTMQFSVRLLSATNTNTATLTSKRCILYIYSKNISTEYFKHGTYSSFFPLQNAVCFIILRYLVLVLFTFYIHGGLKLKKK